LPAIILAGGQGMRLRPLTNDRPKPMVQILGKPILEYQVEWLRSMGVEDIVFCCGYRHEVIQRHFGAGEGFGVKVVYSVEEEPLGRGGAVKRAMHRLGEAERLLVVNGDSITTIPLEPLIEYHDGAGCLATLVAVPFRSPYGVLDLDESNRVRGFREKPELPHWVNAGIYVFEMRVEDYLPMVGDTEEETFPRLAGLGLLAAYKSRGFWRTIDTAKDLQETEDELRTILSKTLLGLGR